MNPRWTRLGNFSSAFLRLALGIFFLSAVADRFGLWGAYGHPNVGWGDYARFMDYTAKLNWFLPVAAIPPLAAIATFFEILFGLLLLLGWKTRLTPVLSGLLLISFALTMTIALGVKAPLNFSVFSAAGEALLLAARETFPFSVDELLRRNTPGKWSARSASSRVPDRKDLLHINMHLCIIAWECAYAGKALGRNRCRRRWLESHPEIGRAHV